MRTPQRVPGGTGPDTRHFSDPLACCLAMERLKHALTGIQLSTVAAWHRGAEAVMCAGHGGAVGALLHRLHRAGPGVPA